MHVWIQDRHLYHILEYISNQLAALTYSLSCTRRKLLAERYPKLGSMVLDENSLTLALNEEYVPAGEVLPLKEGDTVALIPPISGG